MKYPYGLTSREIEVTRCIVDGMNNLTISEALKIRRATVKSHLTNIFNKTGQSTRLELAVFAIRNIPQMKEAVESND